jgi:hypothetical protein
VSVSSLLALALGQSAAGT